MVYTYSLCCVICKGKDTNLCSVKKNYAQRSLNLPDDPHVYLINCSFWMLIFCCYHLHIKATECLNITLSCDCISSSYCRLQVHQPAFKSQRFPLIQLQQHLCSWSDMLTINAWLAVCSLRPKGWTGFMMVLWIMYCSSLTWSSQRSLPEQSTWPQTLSWPATWSAPSSRFSMRTTMANSATRSSLASWRSGFTAATGWGG